MDYSQQFGWRVAAQQLAAGFVDLVLPPRCPSCREIVPELGQICAACWNQIPFLAGSRCRACAVPLEAAVQDEPICEQCLLEPPIWRRAAAALRYEGLARTLILRFKHGDRIEAAKLFGDWLAFAVRPLIQPDSILLPVPLHRYRLLGRGYNQSALLAQATARSLGCEANLFSLRRTQPSRSQQGLGQAERADNVQASYFRVCDRQAFQDRHVILIDDVLTTGSTLTACCQALAQAGTARIDVAALARVVRPAAVPI